MFGTAKATDPSTGRCYDDTVPFVKAITWLSEKTRFKTSKATRAGFISCDRSEPETPRQIGLYSTMPVAGNPNA